MAATTINAAAPCAKCGHPQIGGTWCGGCGTRLIEEVPDKPNTLATSIKVGAVLLFIAGWYIFHSAAAPQAAPAVPQAVAVYPSQSGVLNKAMSLASESVANQGHTDASVFTQAAPSIVTLYRDEGARHTTPLGAGFLIDEGILATNFHVVSGAATMSAGFSDGTFRKVTNLLGTSEQHDVILLRIAPAAPKKQKTGAESLEAVSRQLRRNIPGPGVSGNGSSEEPSLAMQPADPASLVAGATVVGIGSPDGKPGTVARGIVTGFVNSVLVTNIAVAPTSSGGPLVNMQGEVVGILTSRPPAGLPSDANVALPIAWATALLTSTANQPLGGDTFGPYTFNLGSRQKHTIPFTTPSGMTTAQFSATLTGNAAQTHLSLLRNGHLMFDSGDDTHFQLTLKQGNYVLVVENTASSSHDATVQGTFAAAP
jgi:S1-C subfamily serine protease